MAPVVKHALPVQRLVADIADQGTWVGMPRERLEHWSRVLPSLTEHERRLLASQLVVVARGLRQALHERGAIAVLQLVTLVRRMLGERVDVSVMFAVDRRGHEGRALSLVSRADEARRLFEVMTER